MSVRNYSLHKLFYVTDSMDIPKFKSSDYIAVKKSERVFSTPFSYNFCCVVCVCFGV